MSIALSQSAAADAASASSLVQRLSNRRSVGEAALRPAPDRLGRVAAEVTAAAFLAHERRARRPGSARPLPLPSVRVGACFASHRDDAAQGAAAARGRRGRRPMSRIVLPEQRSASYAPQRVGWRHGGRARFAIAVTMRRASAGSASAAMSAATRAPNTSGFQQRVGGQPVGAVHAGRGDLAARPTGRARWCGRARRSRCRPCGSARPGATGIGCARDRCRPSRQAAKTVGEACRETRADRRRGSRGRRRARPRSRRTWRGRRRRAAPARRRDAASVMKRSPSR